MKTKKRRRTNETDRLASIAPGGGAPSATTFFPSGSIWSGQGFTGAEASESRGYVYFPELRSRHELTAYTATELRRRARWLTRNMGIARRFRRGIAEMVGSLRPQPSTADGAWNSAALAAFEDIAFAPLIFDRSGNENFFDRQITLIERALEDGDSILTLTETNTGLPATALFEAPQCASGKRSRTEGWFDGVRVNRDSRRTHYRLLGPDGDETTAVEIDSADVIHFGLFESPHSPRGMTGFVHAVNRLLDIREIDNDTQRGIKAANLVGFYIANAAISGPEKLPLSSNFTAARNPLADMTGATGAQTKDILMETLTRPGGALVEMGKGQELKALHDERRHPNQQAAIDHFIRDCAWGFDWPPEVLWFLGSLTGPAVRFMIKAGERSARRLRRQLATRYCQRIWTYTIARLIKAGRLPRPRDPRWWSCEWIEPESLTIDFGREYNAALAAISQGAGTLSAWYGEAGEDWKKQLTQRGAEIAFAHEVEEKLGIPEGSILGASITGGQAINGEDGSVQKSEGRGQKSEDEDDDEEKPKKK
jgi:capsid protein